MTPITSKQQAILSLVEDHKTHDLQHATLIVELLARRQLRDGVSLNHDNFWSGVTGRIHAMGLYYTAGYQGWVDRKGKLWTNTYSGHSSQASLYGLDTYHLERAGWIHVSTNTGSVYNGCQSYFKRTTERQRRWMKSVGIEIDASYEVSKRMVEPDDEITLDFTGLTIGTKKTIDLTVPEPRLEATAYEQMRKTA